MEGTPSASTGIAVATTEAGERFSDILLTGGGAVGALMRSMEWSRTPLGPPEVWPQSLRTMVGTCLNSRFPILVWWGPDLVMLYNDAYVALIGAKHPDALGRSGREVFPEIWDIIGPMLGGVLTRGEATWSEDQLLLLERHGYPEECYFTFSYSPIRAENGAIAGVFTAVTETTDRVIGQRRLATMQAQAARTAVAHSRDDAAAGALEALAGNPADIPFALLYIADEAGTSARLVGATPSADHLDAPGVLPVDPATATRAGVPWPVAEVVRTRESKLVALPAGAVWPGDAREAMALPVARPGQDRLYGVLIAGIASHLRLNDGYRAFLDLVAGQVAMALANAEAYESQRRRAEALAELDRAKTAFFSNVSHEFRTPLTLLLGPAEEMLAEPGIPDAVRVRVELIHRNGLRLQRLVNSLLEFTRIEAGRVEAHYEPTDLAAFTAELASTFRSAVERAGVMLVVDCPPLSEPVFVDRDMWERVVLNLLSNALKHTFEGSITVRVAVAGGGAELSVSDTGVGIAAEQLPFVFDRFHRVPNARARSHEGTGIGLALVQELVRLHGGQIAVRSEEGRGTAFTVRIPFGNQHLPEEQIHAARGPARAGDAVTPWVEEALRWVPGAGAHVPSVAEETPLATSAPAAGARVLLADDNADMREYLARLLRGQGWVVDAVTDGDAALRAVRREPPDLVLADVMMPGLNGFELLRALRAEAGTGLIPVILLSARAGEESRIEGLSAGADDYMVKPFSARELIARVSAHLSLAAARARAAAEVRSTHAALRVAHERLKEQAEATRAALAALEVEQARLATLFRQAPAFICLLRGPDHVVELANDAYRQLVGFRELVGLPIREAVPEAEGQGFFELLDRVLATGEAFAGRELPLVLQRSPGAPAERRYVTFVYQPIAEADGSRSGIFVHGVDVTEQVVARTQIERARAEAEDARRIAETANRAKSDFLAAMSHDLRTPLNAIAGYAQIMELGVHGPVTEAQREALRRIQRSERHLLSLINDVLNFTKLEAGRLEYDIDDVPLASTVDAVRQMVEPQMASKRLTLSTAIPASIAVRADEEKLHQILLNLLSNALKFTDEGGSVSVDLGFRHDGPQGVVFLRVSDTGIGIPREKQESIFDPFVQVHRGLARSAEGTGLGLAISRELARGMGGDLRVRSTVGTGSAFTVTLPRSAASPQPGGEQRPAA